MNIKNLKYQFLTVVFCLIHIINLCAADISTNKSVGTSKGSLDVSSLGAAIYSIPIEIPKGYGKLLPNISLTYNSQSNYGLLGYGGNISGVSVITRGCKDIFHDGAASGVRYLADDAYFLDGKRLIYQKGDRGQEGATYVIEGNPFTMVTIHGTSSETWMEVQGNDGVIYSYGKGASKLIINNASGSHVAAWYVSQASDAQGRFINYSYHFKNNYAYPSLIEYGMKGGITNVIRFSYEDIKNPNTYNFNLGGVKGNICMRVSSVSTETNNQIFRKYVCEYDSTLDRSRVKYSHLVKVIERNGAGEEYNPTVLEWKGLPGAEENVSLPTIDVEYKNTNQEITSKIFVAADINGDGISDIVKLATVNDDITIFNSNGKKKTTYVPRTIAYVFLSRRNSDGQVSFEYSMQKKIDEQNNIMGYFMDIAGSSVFDFNGDGKQNILFPVLSHKTERGKSILMTTWYILKNEKGEIEGKTSTLRASSEVPLYALFDIDKDGRDEIVYVENGTVNGKYVGGCVSSVNKSTGTDEILLSFNFPKSPKRLFAGDFNADGMMDLIAIYDGGYKIYFNNGCSDFANVFSESNSCTGTSFGEEWLVSQGDFNGDGLIDFVLCDKNGHTSFALNNGNGQFDVKLAITLDMADKNTAKDDKLFSLIPFDQDGDGKTDLLVSKSDFKYHGGLHNHYTYRHTQTVWLRSDGEKLTQEKQVFTNNENDALQGNLLVGDFTGDGQLDVMNYGRNLYAENPSDSIQMRLYSSANYTASSGRVTNIIDGLGGESSIEYASVLDEAVTIPDVNTVLSPVVMDVKGFLPVVKKMVCNDVTKDFQYGGLKYHNQGLGLLGFERTLIKNETSGEITSNIIDAWDSTYYVPKRVTTMTNVDAFSKSMTTETSVVPKDGTYFAFPKKQTASDYDGNLTTVVSQYDLEHGYITFQKTLYDSEAMYKQVAYNHYVNKNGAYYPMEVVKTQKHEDDTAEYTQKSFYDYDDYGQITKEISFAGTSLELTTDYLYDQFGNVTSTTQKGYGVSSVNHLSDYDSTGRFLIKSWQSPEGETISYTNDLWGNVLSATNLTNSEHTLQTTYQYDKWGNLLKTIYPTSIVETNRVEWGSTSDKRYYVEKTCDGKPTLTTWYNYKGQKVCLEYPSLNKVVHSKMIGYNKLGLVTSDVEKIGKQVYYEAFLYDKLGRMVDNKQYNKNKYYHYTYGNRSVTTTIGNQSYTKVMDAWGNVKTSSDPVGSVSYRYNSNGKPVEVNSNGVKVTLEYDEIGNRISLTDPDAGTISSEYSADGKLLKQTDARGVVTTNSYDELGRLTTSKIGEIEINHFYGTSGNEKLRLVKSESNGNVEVYTHDEFGRIVAKTRTAHDGRKQGCTYSYDDKGRLIGKTYPGGLKQAYYYDENGYKVKNVVNGIVVSSLVNFDGKTLQFKLLNDLVERNVELDNGGRIASNRMTVAGEDIFNLQCNYDSKNDNLLSRSGVNTEQETFEYDEADRLLNVKNGDNPVLAVKYSENGNIVCKSDVGNYVYGVKPHAVMSVDNVNAIIPSASLMTQFNSLGKIDMITDGNTLRSVNLSYGPDGQRWTTTSSRQGSKISDTIYGENYDIVFSRDSLKEFFYVDDNVMFARINRRKSIPLLMIKDNLGSILSIYDKEMNKVFDASYDAWGKQTIKTNRYGFIRGYCGHEMLNDFGIINMNGRLYDPVLGRFLSPDNYVQMPDNSQNFNRYSYCLNNPMKYTDPSGEIFGIDDFLFVSVASGAMFGAMHAKMSGKPIWKGVFTGGFSSLACYGVGGLFGHSIGSLGNELLRAGVHGATSGILNTIDGGNFFHGAICGVSSSLMGTALQGLHGCPELVWAASSICGGLTSLAMGDAFMEGFHIGSSIATFNHSGGKNVTLVDGGELQPVVVVAKNLSYRNTFGYWLLGVGSGASSGPYGMWNPDALSMSLSGSIQLGTFHLGGDVGLVMAPGKIYPFISYDAAFDASTSFYGMNASLNMVTIQQGSLL